MLESHEDELFLTPKRSTATAALAAIAAVIITALVFAGYALLRKRHAEDSGSLSVPASTTDVRQPPKALIIVDEALLQGGNTIIGGTVKNTSTEKLEGLSVEMELKRRKDGKTETQLIPLQPSQLEPQQEARYALQLKAQDYSSAKLLGLRAGPGRQPLAYTTTQGQKRPPERLETKTVTVGRPASKGGEFLNSPDNPARVP